LLRVGGRVERGDEKPVIKLPVDKVQSNNVRKIVAEEEVPELLKF
jgi:RNA polymerase-interacting CarD/CdnL/TRCF family regulator